MALATGGIAACAGWAVVAMWHSVKGEGAELATALWTLPLIIPIHLLQIGMAGAAWRRLLPGQPPSLGAFFRLRTVREGIDALLPVAHVGGEFVAAGLLNDLGVPAVTARASMVIDVTVELVMQVAFMLGGLLMLAAVAPITADIGWGHWLEAAGLAILTALALLGALRFGALRLLDRVVRHLAGRWPQLGSNAVAGLEAAARDICRRPSALLSAAALHLLGWATGAAETWLVMHTLGQPISVVQALVLESLGMAARGAGFAVPGGWGVQEAGFMLAATALGLPQAPALSVSIIKRVREGLLGLVGLGWWRWPRWA